MKKGMLVAAVLAIIFVGVMLFGDHLRRFFKQSAGPLTGSEPGDYPTPPTRPDSY